MLAWEDMVRSAVLQLNHTPAGSSGSIAKRENTRSGLLFKKRPDLSKFIALPGQGVLILVNGAKANMGHLNAEAGYYIGSANSSSGWLVRRLRDRKLIIAHHITVVSDLNARPARLLASDDLWSKSTSATKAAQVHRDQIRKVFAERPGAELDNHLVLTDELADGLAVKLVSAVDDDGHLVLLPEEYTEHEAVPAPAAPAATAGDNDPQTASASPGGGGATTPAADRHVSDAPEPEPAPAERLADASTSEPDPASAPGARRRARQTEAARIGVAEGSRIWLRNLADSVQISYPSGMTKTGKSGTRFAIYSKAKTMGEMKEIHPGSSQELYNDLHYDFKKNHLRISADVLTACLEASGSVVSVLASYNTDDEAGGDSISSSSVDGLFSVGEFMFAVEDAMERTISRIEAATAAKAESTPAIDPGTANVHAVDEVAATEKRIAERDPTAAHIADLETLEGLPARPARVGDPTFIDAVLHEAYLDGLPTSVLPDADGRAYEMSGDASKASIFATQPSSPEIKSVAQARRSPVWGVPGGYKDVGKKEVVRVIEEHKAMTYVSKAAVEAARSRYGRENVHIRKIVMPFKEKTSAANFHTRYKARITIADLVVMGKVDNTFAATVAMDSIRFLTNTALRTGGKIRMLDVGGAYLFGTPTDPGAPGGRVLFAPVPEGFDEFGDEYQQYDADGNQMYFRIDGNLPGRQDAGRIWGDMYTSFLVEEGFTQSIVDRRIFSKLVDRNGKKEQIVVGVFVDDSWIMSTHDDLYAEFYDAWAKRFDEAPDVQDTCDEFCGLVFTHRDDGSVSLSCPKLLHNLGEKLAEARAFDASKGSLSGTAKHAHRDCPTTPLGVDGLTFVTAAANETSNPLMTGVDQAYESLARSLLGICGWVATNLRADAYLAFVALAQVVGTALTHKVWCALLRLSAYLVGTPDVHLVMHKTDPEVQWEACVDSSCINHESGGSYGGYVFGYPGSGAFAWKCLVPAKLTDSTAGSELIM